MNSSRNVLWVLLVAAVSCVGPTGHDLQSSGAAEATSLAEQRQSDGSERLFEGWVVIGHEVRSFRPCGQETEFWLAGESPALNEIVQAYRKERAYAEPYTPLFAALSGSMTRVPRDGFGADYEAAFLASKLVHVLPSGECPDHRLSPRNR
jgi:hypothetical protein